ncbi:MAG: PfkB family carbohydrate kinase [Acidobacteria bacterium]|nr:PfkB family carbohydrate kinase [Acidobacteriota bacterium]
MSRRRTLLAILDGMSTARVVLYGDMVLDRFVLGTPKRISREAPVIILRYEGQQDIPGGGANALANLAALDVEVLPVAAVGDDEPGRALRAQLDSRGIDTSHLLTVPQLTTPMKVRILGGGASSLKHQMARYDVEGRLGDHGPWIDRLRESLGQAAAGAGAVAISDYGYGTVTAAAIAGLSELRPRPPWLCLDSRYRLQDLDGVDAATPNLQELEAISGRRLTQDYEVADEAEALRRLLAARFVLTTRGNRGMTLIEEGSSPVHIPVYGTDEVADVTGAGDTVLAVLTAALAAGASPQDAAVLANLAGGIVVMKLGTATVSRDELRTAVLRSTQEPAP